MRWVVFGVFGGASAGRTTLRGGSPGGSVESLLRDHAERRCASLRLRIGVVGSALPRAIVRFIATRSCKKRFLLPIGRSDLYVIDRIVSERM